jgi:hypothetical protein
MSLLLFDAAQQFGLGQRERGARALAVVGVV